jgi:predicted RND superfamily exporter protein
MKTLLSSFEQVIFRQRGVFLAGFLALTAFMLWKAMGLQVDASFNKSLPKEHPYIQTFTQYQSEFGGANRVVVALLAREGEMFTPEFFTALKGQPTRSFSVRASIARRCSHCSLPTSATSRWSRTA